MSDEGWHGNIWMDEPRYWRRQADQLGARSEGGYGAADPVPGWGRTFSTTKPARLRWEQADVRLLSTAVLDCSKSGSFKTDFGDLLRFALEVFAMVAALQRRNDSISLAPFRGQLSVCRY